MKRHIFKSTTILFLTIIGLSSSLSGQPNIQEQYNDFYEKSSTWEDYKVIKLYRLDEFWTVVTDTLKDKSQRIETAHQKIDTLNTQLTDLKSQLAITEIALNESEALNGSISFLGMETSKVFYNIFVWLLIMALAAGVGTNYVMFQRSNVVTTKTRKQIGELEGEFERHRTKARETQIKLKRELQTALNKLSEQRVG